MLISEEEGQARLLEAVRRAGSQRELARIIGVSVPLINQMVKPLSDVKHRAITGKTAEYLGFKRVFAYQLTVSNKDPNQERYENERRAWLKSQDMFYERSQNMQVSATEAQTQGRRYPEKQK